MKHPMRWLKIIGLLLLVGVVALFVFPPLGVAAFVAIAVVVGCISLQFTWWAALTAVGYEPGVSRKQLRKMQASTAALEEHLRQQRNG